MRRIIHNLHKNDLIPEENRNENKIVKAPLSGMQPVLFAVLALFVIFVTYQIFGGILSLFIYGDDFNTLTADINVARVIISFSQFMFILAPVFLLNMLRGDLIKTTFRLNRPNMNVFWLGILGIIVVQPALQSYMYLQELLLNTVSGNAEILKQIKELMDSLEAVTLNLVTAYSPAEFITVSFVIAVTPAICEEFFFRGLIFFNFEKNMYSGKAIFMTGFIFAIYHFHPFNLLPLIVLGFYLTYIVYHSNSILTGIAGHFLFNFISALMVYIYGKEGFENTDGTIADNMPLLIAGAVSAVLFILVLITISRKSSERKIKIQRDV